VPCPVPYNTTCREEFLADWDPDHFDWDGDIHWDAGELARSRGVSIAVEGEQEYEEAPLIGNLSGSTVERTWGHNGLSVAEDGRIMSPSGHYPCPNSREPGSHGTTKCHGWHTCQNAPKWHFATDQGISRSGHFADAVSQDNLAGLIDQDGFKFEPEPGFNLSKIGGPGFCDWCNARFLIWARLHMPQLELAADFSIRAYISEVRRQKSRLDPSGPCKHDRSCDAIQSDPTVHAYIKYQNQAWRDAFELTRNATKVAAVNAGRVPPPVYGNLGGPLVHPFALVMTGSVDVFWMELFHWTIGPNCPAADPVPQAALGTPKADNTLAYKVAEAALWGTNGSGAPIWSDTRKNIYSASTRMYMAEARANGAVPWLLDGSLKTGGVVQWGSINIATSYKAHADFVNANRWLFTSEKRDRVADTAVVFCLSCAAWRRMGSLTDTSRPPNFGQISAIGRLLEDTQTAYEVLYFGHQDLYENNEGLDRLLTKRWRTVILPSVDVLSDTQIQLLSGFVQHGGTLKLLGDIGVRDSELVPRNVDPMVRIKAAAANGGSVDLIPIGLYNEYASSNGTEGGTPLLEAVSSTNNDSSLPPWSVSGPGALQKPVRLWVNCWRHRLYSSPHNDVDASVCHLVNYRLNMSANTTGGVVIPAASITIWLRADLPHNQCTAFSPTRAHQELRTTPGAGRHTGMVGVTLSSMDEYTVIACGASVDSAAVQAAAAAVRKWSSRLVIASGTTGVNASAVVPLLLDAEQALTKRCPGSDDAVGHIGAAATVRKLTDLAYELETAVVCITQGAKKWQAQQRSAVLHLNQSNVLLMLDFGDGPVQHGFKPVTAGAADGTCPYLCTHAVSQKRNSPRVCVCQAPADGWPQNATVYTRTRGYGFLAGTTHLQAGNTAGLPDAFHADAIVSNRTATFRIDVPAAASTQLQHNTLIITVIVGMFDQNVLPSSEGPTPADGDARPAAYRQYAHTYVDYWDSENNRWVGVLAGARGAGAGWWSHRAFRVPYVGAGHAFELRLRFKGGSFGPMHGDNHFGWTITGLIVQRGDQQLTPPAVESLREHDSHAKAALRNFSWVAPFDDSNATALEQDSAGRPSLAEVCAPMKQLPKMPSTSATYVGQSGRELRWKQWQGGDTPVPMLMLSRELVASSPDMVLSDGMLGVAFTCIRPRDPSAVTATLSLSMSGLGDVYWNGQRVLKDRLATGVFAGELVTRVTLREAAWNSLLLSTAHNEEVGASIWAVMAAVYDADGRTPLQVDTDAGCERAKSVPLKVDDDATTSTSSIVGGKLLVDGQPFFIWGSYTHDLQEMDWNFLQLSGYNTVLSYTNGNASAFVINTANPGQSDFRPIRRFMDAAAAHKMKVILNLKDMYNTSMTHDMSRIHCDDQCITALITALVAEFKSHGALLGWYLSDETPTNLIPIITKRQNLVASLDPHHITYFVEEYFTTAGATAFRQGIAAGTSAVFGVDDYPWDGPGGTFGNSSVDSSLSIGHEGLEQQALSLAFQGEDTVGLCSAMQIFDMRALFCGKCQRGHETKWCELS
jgi:hypothetical protein